MKYRLWGTALGAAALALVVGLASGGAFWPTPMAPRGGQLEGEKKVAPRPGGQLKPEAVRAEEAAIRKANQAFTAAFNKGDLDGLMALWAEDAEYTTEAGKAYRGKAAIRALLKKSLATHKGSTQSVKSHSLRLVKPDVATEVGSVTVTAPDGSSDTSRYSALFVKTDGKWLIASIRDLASPEEDDGRPNAYHRLKGLGWLVGEWVDKDSKKTITISCKWLPGQGYIRQDITATEADGKEMRLTHLIGWDPVEETIRSWLFDPTGGFSEAVFQREGNAWTGESAGWFGDGRTASATITWKYVDDNTAEWTSKNRQADEQPLPDLKITFTRKAKAAVGGAK